MSWNLSKLGDNCTITSSRRFHLDERKKEGVPFYSSKEVIQLCNGESITDCQYISDEAYEDVKCRFGVPKENDLLLTTRGTYGIPYLYRSSDKFYFSDGNLTWFKDFGESLDSKFLYYWFKSSEGWGKVDSIAKGTAQKAVPIDALKDLEIPLPPLPIQRRIADILSAYDDLIENNQRQINLLEEAAMRLYREWFVFMRFPGHESVRIVDGVPEGWRQLPAHELFDITIGKTPPRVESRWFSTEIGDIKWISIRDMGDANIFIYNTGECLTKSAVEKFNLNLIPANTVVLSFKLTVGAVAITTENMFTNEAIAHFRINDDRMLEYTYEYLKNFSYKSLGNTSSISSAINSKIVKEMPFILPSKEVIDDFHKQMSPIFAEIRNKSMSIHLLQKARDALLPRLMNGGVGLKLEEGAV